jgi:hypothetical protein
LTELLVRYFGPVSIGKDKKCLNILIIGRYRNWAATQMRDRIRGQRLGLQKMQKRGKEKRKGQKSRKSRNSRKRRVAAPVRPTRKRSLQDFQLEETGDDQGFVEEGDVEDHVPDLPSLDELINAVLDAPAGRTRRKVK